MKTSIFAVSALIFAASLGSAYAGAGDATGSAVLPVEQTLRVDRGAVIEGRQSAAIASPATGETSAERFVIERNIPR
ncbi:hypothetical protein EYW49_10260 [Siculibacillus lacustris]|uniref:Uncharacterized protein n=1 Tax=Siculibacillus lacustris TaxID=1549641 RepID=A0A4Q9VQ93_9HYPH|nr:hypothetical protein [Siculibacillus lacustris]TBW37987.1 hypothetical protein EYW49_10260 [Siculibacillus lacustris]